MPTENVKREIRYLGKDFAGFRDALIQHAKTYFPNTYNDFSDSSLGMMLIEMSAYVGDVLSYYMDDQIKETMLQHATQRRNIIALAHALGYKPKPTVPSVATLKVFQVLPARASDAEPDFDYAINIKEGMVVESTDNGTRFHTDHQLNFASSGSSDPTLVTVYTVNDATNQPTQYLLEKHVTATSGETKTITQAVGEGKQFHKIKLPDVDIIRIEKCVDSNGFEWKEVPYLAQDVIFEDIPNDAANNPHLSQYSSETPYLLKLQRVPKRFTTRVLSDNRIEMQFGAGISTQADEELIPNPDNIGLQIPGGRKNLDASFDPSNFMYTKAYGEAPANTTLTITYLRGGGVQSNVNSSTITKVISAQFDSNPVQVQSLSENVIQQARDSIAVTNDQAAQGGRSFETAEEIRQNAMSSFGSQNRAVTREDYIGRLYSLPPQYGSIAKAYIVQDYQLSGYQEDEQATTNQLALNLYLLGYDQNKKLTTINEATKKNIQTYLGQFRMMTDAINIKDAFIINIGISYEVTVLGGYNTNEVLLRCTNRIKQRFDTERFQINEPIVLGTIYSDLASIAGVQSVLNVSIQNKVGGAYSQNAYNIVDATINRVLYPAMDPACFEVKFPDADIIGKVSSY